MKLELVSTRGRAPAVGLEEALFEGLAPDGGLYVPTELPELSESDLASLRGRDVAGTAERVLGGILAETFGAATSARLLTEALDFPIPLVRLRPGISILELFHGPTLAFKDVAARTMARWMAHFRGDSGHPLTVLVATSGDTGGAVADAFGRVPGVRVVVLYPDGQVSRLQEKQMTTLGEAVTAVAVGGTFDDCQRLVKAAFADRDLARAASLTSANSINIGRLLPQIVYYFHGWAQLGPSAVPPVFCTPSGNFGNLTAGLLARRMGLPVARFLAATNANDVVPRYLETGDYAPGPSRRTLSNAMDVGDPSNFERILALFGDDWERIGSEIEGSSWDDDATREAIGRVDRELGYVLDPHTAVGFLAAERFLESAADGQEVIVLSTAHPAKFGDVVEELIGRPVPLPPALAACLEREGRKVAMKADFGALRELLLA